MNEWALRESKPSSHPFHPITYRRNPQRSVIPPIIKRPLDCWSKERPRGHNLRAGLYVRMYVRIVAAETTTTTTACLDLADNEDFFPVNRVRAGWAERRQNQANDEVGKRSTAPIFMPVLIHINTY